MSIINVGLSFIYIFFNEKKSEVTLTTKHEKRLDCSHTPIEFKNRRYAFIHLFRKDVTPTLNFLASRVFKYDLSLAGKRIWCCHFPAFLFLAVLYLRQCSPEIPQVHNQNPLHSSVSNGTTFSCPAGQRDICPSFIPGQSDYGTSSKSCHGTNFKFHVISD